jgi:hypothetical protein
MLRGDFTVGDWEAGVGFEGGSGGGDEGEGNKVPSESKNAGSTLGSEAPDPAGDAPAGLTSESDEGCCCRADAPAAGGVGLEGAADPGRVWEEVP